MGISEGVSKGVPTFNVLTGFETTVSSNARTPRRFVATMIECIDQYSSLRRDTSFSLGL